MIKNILVCTDGSVYGDVAGRYAIYLANKLKARLLGLHILDSRMLEGPMMADISGWLGAQPYGAQVQQFRELMTQKGEAVIEALREQATKDGVEAECYVKMGHPSRVMMEEEAHAELIVLGQKGEHAEWADEMMGSNAERLIRQSIKPCLITPGEFQTISKILVAYDGSGHAGQALTQAVELALALDIELIITTASDNGETDKASEISVDAVHQAEAHGCRAVNVIVEGPAEEAILETAREQECDFIVVGAYGHSRIRELLLGSTASALITRSHLPVMVVR